MTQQTKRRRKNGFTMVELIVTLVIMGILFAIAVPNLTGYIHLSQFRKNESYAKTMYLSAESALTYYRTGGEWESFKRKVEKEGTLDKQYDTNDDRYGRIYGLRLDKGEYSTDGLDGDAALVSELLSNDTYDQSILNAAVCIEIDISTGQVYSVFYGTACDGLYYASNPTSYVVTAADRWQDMDQRDYDTRRAERLGYYSVKDVANVVNLDMTKLNITSINLVNSETLSLNWSSNSKAQDKDVRYQIEFRNDADKSLLFSTEFAPFDLNGAAQMSLPVKMADGTTANYTFPLEYDQLNKRFSLTLDAMMTAQLQEELTAHPEAQANSSTSITRLGGDLAKPLTIYATIQAFPNEDKLNPGDEYQPSNRTDSNTANTLFGNGTSGGKYEIETFRHLSNIRYMENSGESEFAVTARALDWHSDSVKVYQTGLNNDLLAVSGNYASFPSVPKLTAKQTLDGNSGLLNRLVSIVTGGNTISNLKLDKDSIASGNTYLGLFQQNEGRITSLTLSDPQVNITSNTVKGVGAVCGYSSGTLQSSQVTGAAVTADLSGSASAQGIGGLVGVADMQKSALEMKNLSAAGQVTGTLPSSGIGRGVGGIVGNMTIKNAQVSGLDNKAAVTGSRSAGGVFGYLARPGQSIMTGQDVTDCTNEGLILSSENASAAGENYTGHYIGGIVGYANNVSLGNCVSHAVYTGDGKSFQYQQADRGELLRGRYVGGIMGYSDSSALYKCSTKANGYVLGDSYVGGIVGGTNGRADETFLSDPNKVYITTNASYVIGNSYVGGIIGINQGKSKIENCVNTGVVAGYDYYVGGICGANMASGTDQPTILNCASYVSDTHNKIYNMVTGWGAMANYAGGLTGYNNGTITFDKNAAVSTRSVAGIVVGNNYVGGVVGYNDVNGTIDVVYKLIGGRVRAVGDCAGGLVGLNASTELLKNTLTIQPSSVQGRYYVGGAIGANVVNLTEDTAMDGITVNNSLGTITAAAYCGGLIGYQRTYTASDLGGNADLQQAVNAGLMLPGIANGNVPGSANRSTNPHIITITAKNNTKLTAASNNMTIRAYAYAGGIVGYCESGTKMYVKDCLNAGGFERPDISSVLSDGVDVEIYLSSQGYMEASKALRAELNGEKMRVSIIGGVVGVNGENHVIDHCGNTGTMNGLDAMGGVVGLNEGLITQCTLSGSMGSATQDCIGGIAGLNVGGRTLDTRIYGSGTNKVSYTAGTITNCVTAKNITVTGRNTVGGIVGYNIGCTVSGKTVGGAVKNNTSSANVSGASHVGGIAGENGGTIALSAAQKADTRRVNGTGSGVGGVIGVNTATGALSAVNDTEQGDVIVADGNLTVRGNSEVGGIVGINRGTLSGDSMHYLTSQAAEVRAATDNAGGVVGAQNGTATLRYAKNLGSVTANKGAAGGIVGRNNAGNTVENCIGNGSVTSNDGYAGGVVSENFGIIKACRVGTDNKKVTFITRNRTAAGAICAINHAGGEVSGAELGDRITISGSAFILGAVVGDNYGTVTDAAVNGQPKYDVSAGTLQVGGAVGINRAGGTVSKVKVTSDFKNFTKYQYLGGVVGKNCAASTDETKPETDSTRTTPAGQVLNCTYTGTIDEGKSAVGNCYGGIAGLNNGVLEGDTVSALTIKAKGAYTASSTSSTSDKERLSSHIGGIAGKNDVNGTIRKCYIDNSGQASGITVENGMVGGVTGFNKGTVTMSGDSETEKLMANSSEKSGQVEKISELLANAKTANLKADDNWVKWQNNAEVENLYYNGGGATGGGSTAVAAKRTMQIIVSSNGNLGGVTGYNAPTGELSRCVSGNWLLVNKSDSISVGTGGIVGMNESEKDLSFLLNRAFVGRQLKNQNTSRFAGGIIGTQSNQTTNGWTITGCVNYGTVYGYRSHYSGGIVGQWTSNGGTIEDCYNYGNLQTTYQAGWVGASGGIVAQLYHAASGQDFNILSCQNHGNIYGHNGTGRNQCANDSAGILGNITAYRADNGGGQAYTINVANCVNSAGVNIYSASMASGIVGFFSTDGVASLSRAEQTIGLATENIVLNIDRCRNYAQSLNGNYRFRGGLFGDRYVSGAWNQTGTASQNTYIQNSFSVASTSDSGNNNQQEIASLGNDQGYSVNSYLMHASNNYYFGQAWIMSQNQETNNRVISTWSTYETRRAGAHMLVFGTLENKSRLVAARVGKVFSDSTNSNQNFDLFCDMNDYNTKIDADNDLKSKYDGSEITAGHVLFELPQTKDAYKRFAALYQNDQNGFYNALRSSSGAMSDMDDYVQSYYREFEHGKTALSGDAETENGKYQYKLDTSFTVKLDQAEDGSFDVAITDTDRPLYYEGEVLVDGKTVLSNLRFIPRKNGQGVWKATFDGKSTGYGSGVTTGTFQLPESLAASTAGRNVTLKVRAVSLFEDTAPSDEVAASTDNVAVLPQPDVSLRLYKIETGSSKTAQYMVLLNNRDAFNAFNNWKVTLKLGNQTAVIDKNNPTVLLNGENIKELIVTATAAETNGIKPAAVTQTIPTDTPSSPYTPDGSIKSLDVSYSGSTVDDFTVTASLTVNQSTMDTPPIYRVEVLGTEDGKEIVFAYDDVLTSAGNAVTANFTGLPEQYFADTVTNRRVRAWYAASGLGPVYTYGDKEMAVYPDSGYHAESALTYRTYDAGGTLNDKTVYSFVVEQGKYGHFNGYITTTNLNITPLAAPELPEKLNESDRYFDESGSLKYHFWWEQPDADDAQYSVQLTGIVKKTDSAGNETEQRIGIPTNDVYGTRENPNTSRSFTINADDWQYDEVELKVTRIGKSNTGEVGLSATRRYPVQQRLERPGQPSVVNADTNELVYTIGWSAISDQTGCGQYRIYVQPTGGSAAPLGDAVLMNSTASHYSVERNLEDYAGQTITIYLVAEADSSGQYADSPNGISYTMTVPKRIDAPHIGWATSWNDLSTIVSADAFENGGLRVTVTPQDAASVPPGGSTYLLRATITDADGQSVDYPGKGDVLAMAENGNAYICDLTELNTKYAGCRIIFEARISQSAGQVSSAWVKSGEVILPRVQLATPLVSLSNDRVPLAVKYGVSPELLLNSESWTAQLTTLSWQAVENADKYTVTLTDKIDDKRTTTTLTVDTTEDPPKIEVERGNSRETLAVRADDWYTVKQGDAVNGNYITTGGSTRYYQYTLNTRLQVNGDTYTLSLPNVFSITTHEQQTLQLNNVQTTEVSIIAQSNETDRYTDSVAAERNFN